MTQTKQFNFTQAQVTKLCTMQDELNSYIHPEWKTQGFDWSTAVNDECLEILGHLGWKWWKDNTYRQGITDANKAQIKLELIDILHFILSNRIETKCDLDDLTDWINGSQDSWTGLYELTKMLQANELTENSYEFEIWADMCRHLDLTEQEILETYTQKYVLNKFRQDHGYKTGDYVKVWDIITGTGEIVDGVGTDYTFTSLEDNEVLSRSVAMIEQEGQDTTDEIELYRRLENLYNSRLNK